MQRLAVYCGSNAGTDGRFAELATALGRTMAARGIGLVYGGGKVGLMGALADAALVGGGEVQGVIPEALVELELAHPALTKLHIVGTLHERKAKMTELCDGFIALPGGIGTLDELFEAWSWNALGYHSKPLLLLDGTGFWDSLIAFLDHSTAMGFISETRRAQLLVAGEIDEALDRLLAAAREAKPGIVW